MEPVTLVDAENVRRSRWPNPSREELVALVREWAEATGAHVLLVFDGPAPQAESSATLKVVGVERESADDRIARDAERLARARRPYRLVTSDRDLRARAGRLADDLIGGGTFARTLNARREARTCGDGVGSPATSGPSARSSPATRAGRA